MDASRVASVVVVFVASMILYIFVSYHFSSVEVYEGEESVVLPCQVSWLPEVTKVVWSTFDLNQWTVHQHQHKDEPYVPNPHYRCRTSMSQDALKTRNLSLTLKDPRHSDSGLYICNVYIYSFMMSTKIVLLRVKELPTFFTRFLLPAVSLAVCMAALLACCLSLLFLYNTILVSWVEVKEGARHVVLPFQTATPLPTDFTVEWSRCAPEPMIVHEYRNGHLIRQDKFYSNRTALERHGVRFGDFSLTLRNPCFRDSATYICTVYKNRDIYAQEVVRLKFKEGWWSWFLRRLY